MTGAPPGSSSLFASQGHFRFYWKSDLKPGVFRSISPLTSLFIDLLSVGLSSRAFIPLSSLPILIGRI